MSDAVRFETVEALARSIATGERSAVEVTEAFLGQIERTAERLGTYLHRAPGVAREMARAVDAKRARGDRLGALAGVPVALKDVLATRGMPTTCGSRILEGWTPPYDAHAVERLRGADAVFLGKTNCDEFAMGSSNENSAYGPVRNPWDLERVPGGSSGGSAATVAAREAPLSLGTDTGGSVRQPAAFCGIVGLKPTYGAVSRHGLVAFASSLDQIGPFATCARDAALLYNAICGRDERDMTSRAEAAPVSLDALERGVRGLRIGVPRDLLGEGLDPETRRVLDAALAGFVRDGAEAVDIPLPHAQYSIAAYYLIAPAEASSNLARFDGVRYGVRRDGEGDLRSMYEATRGRGFGREVKRRILLGTYALSAGYYDAYYLRAQKVRTLIRRDFTHAFERADVLLLPTTPGSAFRLGEKVEDPLAMYLSDIFTLPASLAGVPALSFPAGFSSAGLPVGLQVIGRPFEEEAILRVARAHEHRDDAARRAPDIAGQGGR
jgi:aspartyl-tRNA(Asn)/glutamyl-tRNA(Gln) amidotransferase subunit A